MNTKELEIEQEHAADEAFAGYDMHKHGDLPDECNVTQSDHWQENGPDSLIKNFYWDDYSDEEGDVRSSFIVRFKEGSVEIDDAYANVE